MNKLLKHKKTLLLAGDLLLVPCLFFLRWLSGYMLSKDTTCTWLLLGGKCVGCGGTHFVNALLNGQILDAFQHNQFFFTLGVFLIVSYLLLHLHWLWNVPLAKKLLSKLHSIPSLLVFCGWLLVFFFIRNIPMITRIFHVLFS